MSLRRHTLHPLSERIASMEVHEGGAVTMVRGEPETRGRGRLYTLYVGARCQLQLTIPSSIASENIQIAHTDTSEQAPTAPHDDVLSTEVLDFLATHASASMTAVVGSLPVGEYLLVKCPREAYRPRFLCVGNDHVPAGEGVRALLQHQGPPDAHGQELWLDAYILGADPDAPPLLGRPLLGVTLTRFNGSHQSFGLLFLPLGEPATHAPSDEHLLILPRHGELVIDVKHDFAMRSPEHYPDRWRTPCSLRAAELLSGTPAR